MWKEAKVKILVAGTGKRCAPFMETLNGVHGLSLKCLVDASCDPSSMALAKDLELDLVRTPQEYRHLDTMDVLVNLSRDQAVTEVLARNKAGHAVVLEGVGARMVRLIAVALRKAGRFEDRFRQASREMDVIHGEGGRIVGKSKAVQQMQDLIERVAPTPTSVLLLGETGTGKDLAARSIHAQSHLKHKPFVSINCTALSPTLRESELFGYKKGAFTGADTDRKGLLEEADGGTVFLDEIGDMEMGLQAKLLRFLQTGELRRVGSTRIRLVKTRVIAATNRNLEEAVRHNEFRSDLYYRFNTFTIHLPPLRGRKEDIPYLAYHFVTKAEAKLNRRIQAISPEALDSMDRYDWPGNIRELENVIERAAILCQDQVIEARDLALTPSEPEQAVSNDPMERPTMPQPRSEAYQDRRERIMDSFEKKELQRYLVEAQGNVSKAARLSGIPRRTFYRKMNKHGI